MRNCKRRRIREQFGLLRRQFLQEDQLPLSNVLSQTVLRQALESLDFAWKDRVYTPLITLWIFLSQVISADHSCRAAVARLIAHRVANGQSACSPRTGAYCQARKRLPESFFATITKLVGRNLESKVKESWLWKGLHVYMFDGSTVSMPDTVVNQAEYPQTHKSKPGAGFPLARIGVISSLACGAILNFGICSYAGKGTGEVSLLRRLWDVLQRGDVLLADSLMCNWRNIFEATQRGIHIVTRINKALRKADFRKGKRLGKDDHIVQWPKPKMRGVRGQAYKAMPEYVEVREVRIQVEQPGFRSKEIVIVTTLLDPTEFPKQDLAELFRARWNQELDLRSIKATMQMDFLRCKTPELVRKEAWTHLLAYNLIRTVMAQAADQHDIEPRTLSFKGTIQTLEAFQPFTVSAGRSEQLRAELYQQLLDTIVIHRVANRPDRFEPRRKKRRRMPYDLLSKPRTEAKLDILKGLTKN